MAVFTDITTLIKKLNAGDKCWNFTIMKIGTCFTIKCMIYMQTKFLSKLEEKQWKKTFLLPTQLNKLITSDVFKKTKAER